MSMTFSLNSNSTSSSTSRLDGTENPFLMIRPFRERTEPFFETSLKTPPAHGGPKIEVASQRSSSADDQCLVNNGSFGGSSQGSVWSSRLPPGVSFFDGPLALPKLGPPSVAGSDNSSATSCKTSELPAYSVSSSVGSQVISISDLSDDGNCAEGRKVTASRPGRTKATPQSSRRPPDQAHIIQQMVLTGLPSVTSPVRETEHTFDDAKPLRVLKPPHPPGPSPHVPSAPRSSNDSHTTRLTRYQREQITRTLVQSAAERNIHGTRSNK